MSVAFVLALIAIAPEQGLGGTNRVVGTETGLRIPRFVSLKASLANVRYGPSVNHDIKWTFTRRRIPLEILAEFENWRRIRDWNGEIGWIHQALLSSNRTALVSPWRGATQVTLRSEPEAEAPAIARVQSKVLVQVTECDGEWCNVTVRKFDGYVRQDRLWGVYPGEEVVGGST